MCGVGKVTWSGSYTLCQSQDYVQFWSEAPRTGSFHVGPGQADFKVSSTCMALRVFAEGQNRRHPWKKEEDAVLESALEEAQACLDLGAVATRNPAGLQPAWVGGPQSCSWLSPTAVPL